MAFPCLEYCMGISFLGIIFLFYWGLLVATESELMYVHPKTTFDGAVSLFFGSFIYLLIFCICYYFKYYTKTQQNDLSRYIKDAEYRMNQEQSTRFQEMTQIQPSTVQFKEQGQEEDQK